MTNNPLSLNVINLWAGPGAGKSTTAAGLFNLMKLRGFRVELVTEVAKDFTYSKSFSGLQNQLLVLGLQDQRLRRLVGQVDWAITDSPLPLAQVYATPEYYDMMTFACEDAYLRYNNFDVLLRRVKPYQSYGRNETEAAAIAKDSEIATLYGDMASFRLLKEPLDGGLLAPGTILQALEAGNFL